MWGMGNLDPLFGIANFGSIKGGTGLQNDCTEQDAIQTGKTWQLVHSTGYVTEYNERANHSKVRSF